MKIGELATAAGVGVETIRFYQRQELLPEPSKPTTGYRQYDDDSLEQLLFIRRAKSLGLSLKEIRRVIELRAQPSACAKVCSQMTELRDNLRTKIDELKTMERRLTQLLDDCPKEEGRCLVLESLTTR